ncbi:uncharacterized protein LOC134775108 [Penaeus indicus]|uniref:uncharacterized protein LOC134775108 n=1 Tax=Penaeus indicus TaxID=29960 RepID=UPI00300D3C8F
MVVVQVIVQKSSSRFCSEAEVVLKRRGLIETSSSLLQDNTKRPKTFSRESCIGHCTRSPETPTLPVVPQRHSRSRCMHGSGNLRKDKSLCKGSVGGLGLVFLQDITILGSNDESLYYTDLRSSDQKVIGKFIIPTTMAAAALFLLAVAFPATLALPDVVGLGGEADFHAIRLHWKFPMSVPELYAFVIDYCEDQPWGQYRCKKMQLKDVAANEIGAQDAQFREFAALVSGLRMATNYTLEVTPVLEGEGDGRGRTFGSGVVIRTKGFSARATHCLANSSVVEVDTGPKFGGKLSAVSGRIERQLKRMRQVITV